MKWLGRKEKRPFCTAVVAAAGHSSRFGPENKLFSLLSGVPVLGHALLALQNTEMVDAIVVAAAPDDILAVGDICRAFQIEKVTKVVSGGGSRTQSVLNALLEAPPQTALAAVHDGARPLVTPALVERVIRAAGEHRAAIPAVPLKDTVKASENGWILGTRDRNALCAVQTPQVFDIDLLKGALTMAVKNGWTVSDDSEAAEKMGARVFRTEGEYRNLKITTPEDLWMAQGILLADDPLYAGALS